MLSTEYVHSVKKLGRECEYQKRMKHVRRGAPVMCLSPSNRILMVFLGQLRPRQIGKQKMRQSDN